MTNEKRLLSPSKSGKGKPASSGISNGESAKYGGSSKGRISIRTWFLSNSSKCLVPFSTLPSGNEKHRCRLRVISATRKHVHAHIAKMTLGKTREHVR